MRDGRWAYTIRAYAPTNRGGALILETVHANAQSKNIEVEAFRARMARREIDHIEVIAHVEPFGVERIYA